MGGPFGLVVNPAAGRGRSRRVLAETTAALDAAGAACHVTESASLDHARDLAAQAGQRGQVVVAVGGDGLAGALAGAAAAAGAGAIIPAGNGNDLARALGIPSGAAAARVLTAGRVRRMDLIAVAAGDEPEVIVAGSVYLGIPAVAGQIANRTRWLRGPVVYPAAALRAVGGRRRVPARRRAAAFRDPAARAGAARRAAGASARRRLTATVPRTPRAGPRACGSR